MASPKEDHIFVYRVDGDVEGSCMACAFPGIDRVFHAGGGTKETMLDSIKEMQRRGYKVVFATEDNVVRLQCPLHPSDEKFLRGELGMSSVATEE